MEEDFTSLRDEFNDLATRVVPVQGDADLFVQEAHFEMLWTCVKRGDMKTSIAMWGYTDFAAGKHGFDCIVSQEPYKTIHISYSIRDLIDCKTKQDLITLTNRAIVEKKLVGEE